MLVLGIETSCDDTCACVISQDKTIRSFINHSQINKHSKFGGVVPEIASREHLIFIEKVVTRALSKAKLDLKDIDLIAATGGPGLIGGLIVGTSFAHALAIATNAEFMMVNHLEAHILSALFDSNLTFPYLCLLVSGGHTQTIGVFDIGKYKLYGQTLDDSVGESFDKVARMLNLPYPGGPAIEEKSLFANEIAYNFPIPLKGRKNSDFSLSGLKTFVNVTINKLKNNNQLNAYNIANIAACFQKTISDMICNRISFAIESFKNDINKPSFPLVMAGGVAANKYIRSNIAKFAKSHKLTFFVPKQELCTDNGAMVALCAMLNKQKKINSIKTVNPNLEINFMK